MGFWFKALFYVIITSRKQKNKAEGSPSGKNNKTKPKDPLRGKTKKHIVIPAKAGIQNIFKYDWIPGQARNDK